VDWWTKLEGGRGGVLHLRPSHYHVAGDLGNAGRFVGVIGRGRRTGQTVGRDNAAEASSE